MKKNNKKLKVAFYIDTMNKGGTEKATLDLINNLSLEKYDITLIKFFPGGEYNRQINKKIINKTKYKVLSLFRWNKKLEHKVKWWGRNFFDRISPQIAHKILIGDKYDVEVACGHYFPTKIVRNSPRARKISWVHMDYSKDESIIGSFTMEEGQRFFQEIDKIVCVSKECEEKFNDKFDMRQKTVARYNIVDANRIESFAKEKAHTGFSKNALNIVTVGRLTKQKGYDILLKVHKDLIEEGIKHFLYIIGDGEDREKLNQYIESNDLQNTVKLLGYIENPYPYISSADLFVCSSRHESFSLVVAESLILGTPVVSTACTGPNELLDGGKYGLITENSRSGLYEGLKKVIMSTETLHELGIMASKRKEFFKIEKSIQKWEEILDEAK